MSNVLLTMFLADLDGVMEEDEDNDDLDEDDEEDDEYLGEEEEEGEVGVVAAEDLEVDFGADLVFFFPRW
jgi:hypothetical protein